LEDGDLARFGSPAIPEHFVVTVKSEVCTITSLAVEPVMVNGTRTESGRLESGDQVFAGEQLFRVYLVQPWMEAALESRLGYFRQEARLRAWTVLATQTKPLYAVVDAARAVRVRSLLEGGDARYESLYSGAARESLADVAPYLVALEAGSTLLAGLIAEGWGASWGCYLTSSVSFEELRTHFRRFLLVETEDRRQLYFRFYDPRVLRSFLPTCTPEEVQFIFGPVSSYWIEDSDPSILLRLSPHELGCRCDQLPLEIALETSGQKQC
jgi:hypothetical protein